MRALLEQLQSSQAWQAATATAPAAIVPTPPPPSANVVATRDERSSASVTEGGRPSVADLLAQLQGRGPALEGPSAVGRRTTSSTPWTPAPPPEIIDLTSPSADVVDLTVDDAPVSEPAPYPPALAADLRALSYTQALPHLARLGEDQAFVAAVQKVRKSPSLRYPEQRRNTQIRV